MKWKKTDSEYVRDHRGTRAKRGAKLGIGAIIVALVGVFVGPEAAQLVQQFTSATQNAPSANANPAPLPADQDPDREVYEFLNWLAEDVKNAWTDEFAKMGKRYSHAELIVFREAVNTKCGYSTAAIGPFYCPPDRKAYIDLSFYRELARGLGAPGDFAQAYVYAHEIGHHVQNELGISRQMRAAQARQPRRKNELSVRLELQADCFAGIWAHHTDRKGFLEPGDIEEGLRAAESIGDDRLQKRSSGTTNPETWTHGSSAQRMRWFQIGHRTGDFQRCDTFTASSL